MSSSDLLSRSRATLSESALPPRYAKRRVVAKDDDAPSRLAKRRKLEAANDESDAMDVDPEESAELSHGRSQDKSDSPTNLKAYRKEILANALSQNTIALLPGPKQTIKLLKRFIRRACAEEQTPSGSAYINRKRCVLFLTKSDEESRSYIVELALDKEDLVHGMLTPSQSRDEISSNIDGHDILFLTVSTLLDRMVSTDVAATQARAIIVPDIQALGYDMTQAFEEITQDFYLPTAPSARPRVLATVTRTSAPWFAFDHQLLALERLSESLTYGFTDAQREEVARRPNFPTATVVTYEPSSQPPDTPLLTKLREACSPAPTLCEPFIRRGRRVLRELGPSASDWTLMQSKGELEAAVTEGDTQEAAMERILEVLKNHKAAPVDGNVSTKLGRLLAILKEEHAKDEDLRSLVFVRCSQVARAAMHVLPLLLPFIRPRVVVGNTGSADVASVFCDFADGVVNILIATRSTEDLEFPKASLVVQFDLFDDYVSYAYSRLHGRSRLVLLAECEKQMHRRIVQALTLQDDAMDRWISTLVGNRTLVPHRPLQPPSGTVRLSDNDDEDDQPSVLDNAASSGRLSSHDAVSAIFRYAAMHKTATETPLLEVCRVREAGRACFMCTVHLPGAPITHIRGPTAPSRWEARRAACIVACTTLYRYGSLDARFFRHRLNPGMGPIPYNKPTNGASGGSYPRRVPPFWAASVRAPPTEGVFPLILECVHRDEEAEQYRPLLLVTRYPLPDVPAIRVYDVPNVREVRLRRAAPLQLDEAQRELLVRYTERIVRTIANKDFTCVAEGMLWTVAPLNAGWQSSGRTAPCDVNDAIDWQGTKKSVDDIYVPVRPGTAEELEAFMEDAVVQGRRSEMTRRYFFVRVRRDLTPLSKPADSPREALYENIFEFARSASRELVTLEDFNQPLIEVERVSHMHNCLSSIVAQPEKGDSPAKYLIPELCAKTTIPARVLRTAMLLPSVLTRIDEILLVKELNAVHFRHIIAEDLLHAAVTTSAAAFDRNYERLELYGDAFLKYLASLHLFSMSTNSDSEGRLHAARRPLIRNQRLMESALALGLPSFIISKPFVIKYWAPANFRIGAAEKAKEKEQVASPPVPTKPADDTTQHEGGGGKKRGKRKKRADNDGHRIIQLLSDKGLADVMEAILGAAHLSGGRDAALQVAKALGLSVAKTTDIWDDFSARVTVPTPPPGVGILRPGTVEGVEAAIGRKLAQPQLLAHALTHANMQSPVGSYERFEFLGDAILDFLIVQHLYKKYSQQPPGVLTLLKSAMVANSPLAAVCVETGLYKYLNQKSQQMQAIINTYITTLQKAKQEEYEAADDDLRDRGQYWFNVNPPKPLSDIVESVIGAIYVSDNLDATGVQQFFDNILQPFYDKHVRLSTLAIHPTKTLLELVQNHGCHDLELVRSSADKRTRCDVLVHGAVFASETATNGSLAAKAASVAALNVLESEPQLIRNACSCRAGKDREKGKNFDQLLLNFKT